MPWKQNRDHVSLILDYDIISDLQIKLTNVLNVAIRTICQVGYNVLVTRCLIQLCSAPFVPVVVVHMTTVTNQVARLFHNYVTNARGNGNAFSKLQEVQKCTNANLYSGSVWHQARPLEHKVILKLLKPD